MSNPTTASNSPTTTIPPESVQPVEHRVSFHRKDGRLVETVASDAGEMQFCVEGEGLQKLIVEGDLQILPHQGLKLLVEKKVVRFASKPEKCGTTQELLTEIGQFIHRYADAPQEWVDVISLYTLMTWAYDRFTAVPYLRFLGEPGTGKTRLLQVASAISYKGTTVSDNITGAALFRVVDLVQGTLAVDEADFKDSGEWSDITKVLNNGYMAGTPVIRCNRETFDPECFSVYSPKIISTRNRFEDAATESRCITFETSERKVPAHIPLQLPIAFEEEALSLRNKLLQWRGQNYRNVTANETGLRDGLSPRTGQIGASLAAVAPDEEWTGKLIRFLHRMDEGRNETSENGAVIRAIKKLADSGLKSAKVNEVTQSVNGERSELGLEDLTPHRVGGILRSIGYRPKRTMHGYVIPLVLGGESEPVPAFRILPGMNITGVGA